MISGSVEKVIRRSQPRMFERHNPQEIIRNLAPGKEVLLPFEFDNAHHVLALLTPYHIRYDALTNTCMLLEGAAKGTIVHTSRTAGSYHGLPTGCCVKNELLAIVGGLTHLTTVTPLVG
jgi:hypothetical protein